MSDRERAVQLLEQIPESKMLFVVDMLNSIRNLLIDEVEPDEWDIRMMKEAEAENNGETISLEELLKRDGLTYADLQDQV